MYIFETTRGLKRNTGCVVLNVVFRLQLMSHQARSPGRHSAGWLLSWWTRTPLTSTERTSQKCSKEHTQKILEKGLQLLRRERRAAEEEAAGVEGHTTQPAEPAAGPSNEDKEVKG